MTIQPIGEVIYEYTCDLCGKQDRGKWMMPNWEGISIALSSGGTAQFHICQECVTDCSIAHLFNKVKQI